jgi:hypothetical protein
LLLLVALPSMLLVGGITRIGVSLANLTLKSAVAADIPSSRDSAWAVRRKRQSL